MGRAPCCDKANVKKGPWSPDEDEKLKSYIDTHGTGGNWITLPQKIGLKRCGKSCRLRWLNYLRPNIKHGAFSDEEDTIICSLYIAIGSRWSIIAAQLPGRTDNDIKNHWNTKLKTMLLGKHRKNQKIRARACNYDATRINKAADNMQAAIKASPALLYTNTPHEEASSNTILLHSDDHVMKFPIYQAQVAPSFTIPHLEPTTMPAAFSWTHESSIYNDATPTWQGQACSREEGGYYGCSTMKVEGMNCLYQGMKESFVWSTAATEMMSSYDEKLYMATE